jgi:23S rRNA pseudouridine1911/1915/1917 synthase
MSDYKFIIEDNVDRLDVFLSKKTNLSRSKIKKLIQNREIKVNSETKIKSGMILKPGDKIEFKYEEENTQLKAQNKDLDIIFEDDDILVINKPAGLIVHPGSGNHEGTLVNYVYGYLGSKPYLVHRLDKDTSGIIVVAKTEENLNNLQKQWQDRKVKKYYKTLVFGNLDSKEGIIDSPITRNKMNRQEMTISASDDARHAKTQFQVIEVYQDTSLVDVEIFTGRTHQIRVHFKAINHPVVCDTVYGNQKLNDEFRAEHKLNRQFLHAYKLEFKHPKSNKVLKLTAELAQDLKNVIKEL